MIASAIKVNVATAMPSENVSKLELYPSVTHITVVVFLSKCMTGQAPHYLSDQFTTRIAVTGRMTQSCQLLNIPLYK